MSKRIRRLWQPSLRRRRDNVLWIKAGQLNIRNIPRCNLELRLHLLGRNSCGFGFLLLSRSPCGICCLILTPNFVSIPVNEGLA